MSNLLTLSQDEIDRFNLKGKVVGDVITAEEYSKLQKEHQAPKKEDSSKEEVSKEVASDKKKK